MNEYTADDRAAELATVMSALVKEPQDDRAVLIKRALNNLLWEHVRPSVTVEDADKAACVAFDAIWKLCETS